MKDFLSAFMKKHQEPGPEVLQRFENLFERTCAIVVQYLGEKPFHVRAGLNSAVFDCVMVSFANNLDLVSEDVHQRYKDNLLKDPSFLKYVGSGTTDEEVVKNRFQLAEQRLFQA